MDLFIKYQIPPDILSFAGNASTPGADRVAAVRSYVAAMQSSEGRPAARAERPANDTGRRVSHSRTKQPGW